jgi:hypothetical protein
MLGYDVYDKFSKPYQKLFDSLTVTYVGDGFIKAAEEGRAVLYDKPRGSPKNVGKHLSAIHPLVRTNPVTGYDNPFAASNLLLIISADGRVSSGSAIFLNTSMNWTQRRVPNC